jgi:Predicted exonuclease of the beta-lactamase fold involved in RNA processing
MKVYYDTEFLENGSTIRLISIGLIREDGKSLYRVVYDYTLMKDVFMHPWLRQNVVPSLPYEMTEDGVALTHGHPDYLKVMDRAGIAEDVKRFLVDTPNLELWAYYSAYDHVALCQLFGRMIDLPNGIPMYTNDLRSEIQRMGNVRVPEQLGGHHNALADATWNKDTHEYLQGLQRAKELILFRD